MGLKQLFEDDSKLRSKFKKEFLKPVFDLKCDRQVTPLTKNVSLVGTAFDYLMRFKIEYINKRKVIEKRNWFADSCYEELTILFFNARNTGRVWLDEDGRIYDGKILLNSIDKLYKQAKNNYADFIVNGEITNKIVCTTLFLAKLDVYGRSGKLIPNFKSDPKDVKDLKSLISIVDDKNFIARKRCCLNPTFGKVSELIGADADIIIDNTLIEIKVVRDIKLKSDYTNQLLGYYLLSLAGGINGKKEWPIENLGIYFARHAILWKVPISNFASQNKFKVFNKEFANYIKKRASIDHSASEAFLL